MTLFQPGSVRLGVLSSVGGSIQKTLWLPPPAPGYPKVEFEAKQTTVDLVTGAERTRLLGYIPVLTLKWTIYDDRSDAGWTIGTLDGNRPGLEQLLQVLSGAPGTLKVSPGPSAGAFVVGSVKVQGPSLASPSGFGRDLQVVLRGRDILSTMALGAF